MVGGKIDQVEAGPGPARRDLTAGKPPRQDDGRDTGNERPVAAPCLKPIAHALRLPVQSFALHDHVQAAAIGAEKIEPADDAVQRPCEPREGGEQPQADEPAQRVSGAVHEGDFVAGGEADVLKLGVAPGEQGEIGYVAIAEQPFAQPGKRTA